MNRDYYTHWLIGMAATVVWLWGDKLGITPDAIMYAKSVVPLVVGHALAYTPTPGGSLPNSSAPQSGAPSQTE